MMALSPEREQQIRALAALPRKPYADMEAAIPELLAELDRMRLVEYGELVRLRGELARVEAERDEAREGAHQLDVRRPTTWAYEQACAALEKHRAQVAAVLALLPEEPTEDINASWIPPRRVRMALNAAPAVVPAAGEPQ